MTTTQTEVRGASDSHVTDGTLEGEALTHSTLSPPHLATTMAAVHTKLDAFVRFRRTGCKLEDLGSLVLQPPSMEDLPVTLLKVIKLHGVGWVQQPFIHVVLFSLSLAGVCVHLVGVAIVVRRGLPQRRDVLRISTDAPGGGGGGV